jgi:hypothetical protein
VSLGRRARCAARVGRPRVGSIYGTRRSAPADLARRACDAARAPPCPAAAARRRVRARSAPAPNSVLSFCPGTAAAMRRRPCAHAPAHRAAARRTLNGVPRPNRCCRRRPHARGGQGWGGGPGAHPPLAALFHDTDPYQAPCMAPAVARPSRGGRRPPLPCSPAAARGAPGAACAQHRHTPQSTRQRGVSAAAPRLPGGASAAGAPAAGHRAPPPCSPSAARRAARARRHARAPHRPVLRQHHVSLPHPPHHQPHHKPTSHTVSPVRTPMRRGAGHARPKTC